VRSRGRSLVLHKHKEPSNITAPTLSLLIQLILQIWLTYHYRRLCAWFQLFIVPSRSLVRLLSLSLSRIIMSIWDLWRDHDKVSVSDGTDDDINAWDKLCLLLSLLELIFPDIWRILIKYILSSIQFLMPFGELAQTLWESGTESSVAVNYPTMIYNLIFYCVIVSCNFIYSFLIILLIYLTCIYSPLLSFVNLLAKSLR
jgi:hypothetical protein